MNTLIFVVAVILLNIAATYFFIKSKLKHIRNKGRQMIANKPNANERIISCPSCSQLIKFAIPIKSNKAQCRKCAAQFKLDFDSRGNVYITEIKIPEDENTVKSLEQCYAILEIKPDAIPMDIRAAYKKKIMEYHPDKVESLGIKIKQLAEEETRRINAAYAMLQEFDRV